MKGTIFRLLLIVALVVIIGLAYYAYSRFAGQPNVSTKTSTNRAKVTSVNEEEKGEDVKKAEAVIDKWYQLSDENDRGGLKKLLAGRWFEASSKQSLDRVLKTWSFSAEEKAAGYHGVTLKYEVISSKMVESVYGKVVSVKVENKFELWDIGGHHIREGLAVFNIAAEAGSSDFKIRELQWKTLKDTSL